GRHGQSRSGTQSHLRACLAKAERALDRWAQQERVWDQVKAALQPFTPQGELNPRARAEALLAELLPQLPDADFAACKRQLRRPETLTYLDEIQRKLAAVPGPVEVRQAAVRQEGLRRRPELLRGATPSAATLRGVLLCCALV